MQLNVFCTSLCIRYQGRDTVGEVDRSIIGVADDWLCALCNMWFLSRAKGVTRKHWQIYKDPTSCRVAVSSSHVLHYINNWAMFTESRDSLIAADWRELAAILIFIRFHPCNQYISLLFHIAMANDIIPYFHLWKYYPQNQTSVDI